jgi:hypothetical protein
MQGKRVDPVFPEGAGNAAELVWRLNYPDFSVSGYTFPAAGFQYGKLYKPKCCNGLSG